MIDHNLYFMTVTFEDQFLNYKNDLCLEYFKFFYQKVNQKIVNRGIYNKHLKSKMIFVPEYSYDTRSKNLFRSCHYHGFVMIPKEVNQKFHKKCIQHIYHEVPDKNKPDEVRIKCIMNPSLFRRPETGFLKHYSVDFQILNETSDTIFNVCNYITKNLGNWYDKNHRFKLSDIDIKHGSKDERTNIRPDQKDKFHNEDILYFADISQTKPEDYKPIRVQSRKRWPKTSNKSPVTPFRIKMADSQKRFLERFYAQNGTQNNN